RAHQAPFVQVPFPVEDEERVPADEWTEDRARGLAGPQRIAVAAEDVPDGLGIRGHDELPRCAEGVDRVAITPPSRGLDGRIGSERVGEALPETRRARSWRERRPARQQLTCGGGLHGTSLPRRRR